MEDREWGEPLVAELLIATSAIKPQVCSINLSRLKPTLLKVSGGTGWNPLGKKLGYSVDAWNSFQTGGYWFHCAVWTGLK